MPRTRSGYATAGAVEGWQAVLMGRVLRLSDGPVGGRDDRR